MSSQSQSRNPTSYMGVLPINPCNVTYHRRDPLSSDFRNFVLGDRWLNESADTIWTLVGKTAVDGTWILGGGGGGTVITLTPDIGGAVSPTASNINIIGDATKGVSTSNVGASTLEITIADGSSVTPGVLQLATNAETIAGTNTTKAVTPDDLNAKLGPLTQYTVLIGEGASAAIASVGPGVAGQVLQSGGPAANPAYSTAVYPSTTAQGALLSSTTANNIVALAKDTNATRYLSNTGVNNNAAWAQVNLANGVTGVLPVVNGGTGVSSIPSFAALKTFDTPGVTGAGATYVVIPDTVQFNVGSGYNNLTGIFTAPVTGKYIFTARVGVTNCTIASSISVKIFATIAAYETGTNRSASINDLGAEITQLIPMTAGNTAYMAVAVGGEVANTNIIIGDAFSSTAFSGILISA